MTKNTIYFSLTRASDETGKSKSVISKALKNGTLSYISKDDSGYKIDPAELFRVFPKNGSANSKKERSRTTENDLENAFKIKELEIKLDAENKEKFFYKEQYRKMETERDDWKNQAKTLLLQSPSKVTEASKNIAEKKSYWEFVIIVLMVIFFGLCAFLFKDKFIDFTSNLARSQIVKTKEGKLEPIPSTVLELKSENHSLYPHFINDKSNFTPLPENEIVD